MKLVSWNVNGLRACLEKGFMDFFNAVQADIFCLQECKLSEGQLELNLGDYHQYFNYAEKKGYSGTAVFTRIVPLKVTQGMGILEHDREGRILTLEFNDFSLVNVYAPNSKSGLARLGYRMIWEEEFRRYVQKLDRIKPVIICGDLNVAHQDIDLKNPKTNRQSAGFTDEERTQFSELLAAGFIDTFRYFYPERTEAYTWWSYLTNARARNAGWRIDYFCVSERLKEKLEDACIYDSIHGSDHCPVGLTMSIPAIFIK